ncbi:hypothetical protein BaRGS_00033428, partial [Batillaria attramentaria]
QSVHTCVPSAGKIPFACEVLDKNDDCNWACAFSSEGAEGYSTLHQLHLSVARESGGDAKSRSTACLTSANGHCLRFCYNLFGDKSNRVYVVVNYHNGTSNVVFSAAPIGHWEQAELPIQTAVEFTVMVGEEIVQGSGHRILLENFEYQTLECNNSKRNDAAVFRRTKLLTANPSFTWTTRPQNSSAVDHTSDTDDESTYSYNSSSHNSLLIGVAVFAVVFVILVTAFIIFIVTVVRKMRRQTKKDESVQADADFKGA